MSNRPLLLACFASGVASLFYEILWTRAFGLILGSTTQAVALVFAAFLTGLALGAWLFGGVSARFRSPLRVYGYLEVGIALTAVATGLVLHHQADAIGAALGVGAERYLVLFLLALLMVLPPTLLMGGTLPVLLWAAQQRDPHLSIVGRFYGINTLGAAVGTLVCGFFAIRLLGVTASYYCAMVLNLLVAVLAFTLARGEGGSQPAPVAAPVMSRPAATAPEWYLLLVAVASGLAVLSLEVVWARFASFFIGNRTYAFSTLMFSVLTLLSLGSLLSSRLYATWLREPTRNPLWLFALLLAVAALAVLLSGAAGWWLIGNQAAFEARLPSGEAAVLAYRFAEAFALLALPLVSLGALFPLAIALSRECSADIGGTSARYYMANAAGVVVGSLGTGFVGLALLGSFGMLKLIAVLLLALLLFTALRIGRPWPALPLVLGALAGFCVTILPSAYPPMLAEGERHVVETEDAHGLFRLTELANGRLQVTNNRSELIYHLGAYSTDFVQQMQGHLGVHFKPDATTALVIGSGYGITAGALALYEQMERVDAVEILPAMVEAAPLFEPHNFGYQSRDNVNVVVGDGRHFLLRENRQYDIISLNVSDPHLPGGATLFHLDFYELAKRHLKPGGVVIQHVFGSEVPIIAATMAAAFPYTQFSQSYANGFNAVASMSNLDERAVARFDLPTKALRQLRTSSGRRRIGVPGFLPYEELPERFRGDIIATDDRPAVEFSWNPGEKLLFINE